MVYDADGIEFVPLKDFLKESYPQVIHKAHWLHYQQFVKNGMSRSITVTGQSF